MAISIFHPKHVCEAPAPTAYNLVGEWSGRQTASALIHTGRCLLLGIKGLTDGANQLTLSIYDNTTATGTIKDKCQIPGADGEGGIIYPAPMRIDTGIYVTSSGGTHEYYIYYAIVI